MTAFALLGRLEMPVAITLAPATVSLRGSAVAEHVGRAGEGGLDAAKPSTRRDILQRLERARAHLHAHLDRNVALGELASVARLSRFHLARYFKRAFGAARSTERTSGSDIRSPGNRPRGHPVTGVGFTRKLQ